MSRCRDITGQTFGRLTVVSRSGSQNNKATWLCLCGCGGTSVVPTGNLKSGGSTTCGCGHTKHGHSANGETSPTFKTWHSMLGRCLDKKNKNYHRYGGRGVTVCAEWLSFSAFLADMGERPDGRSLDRMDNDGGYFKDNCRWATSAEQARNKSTNRHVTVGGITKIVTDWGDYLCVPPPMIYVYAKRKGVSLEDAILNFMWRDK